MFVFKATLRVQKVLKWREAANSFEECKQHFARFLRMSYDTDARDKHDRKQLQNAKSLLWATSFFRTNDRLRHRTYRRRRRMVRVERASRMMLHGADNNAIE